MIIIEKEDGVIILQTTENIGNEGTGVVKDVRAAQGGGGGGRKLRGIWQLDLT